MLPVKEIGPVAPVWMTTWPPSGPATKVACAAGDESMNVEVPPSSVKVMVAPVMAAAVESGVSISEALPAPPSSVSV